MSGSSLLDDQNVVNKVTRHRRTLVNGLGLSLVACADLL
jgi:hypothetical protein